MNKSRTEDHWYDGTFYPRVVDPWLEGVRRKICEAVVPGSSVLDLGCGTAALAVQLAPICGRIVGVEKSHTMAQFARQRVSRRGLSNIVIRHDDARDLTRNHSFDYAVASLVLHGVPKAERDELLQVMRTAAARLLLADYRSGTLSLSKRLKIAIPEFLAGPEHFRNYRAYRAAGGVEKLVTAHSLKVEHRERDPSGCYSIVCARPPGP